MEETNKDINTKEPKILCSRLTAEGKQFRIRKLTERECFRLMGVDDSDIDIIQASKVSRSQQYKLAGNSIVVDVLAAIFDKMFLHTQSDDAQLKLF